MSLLDNNFDITSVDLMINICKRFLLNHRAYYGFSEENINNVEITIAPNINELSLFENSKDYVLCYYINFYRMVECLKCCIYHKKDLACVRSDAVYTNINDILNYIEDEPTR